MEKPLSVAIAAVIKDNRILLIKRLRGDYVGMWALPGGKINKNEHLREAAIREIKEESGLDTSFNKFLGIISEHLIENNEVVEHFLLHLCSLDLESSEITKNQEGKLDWFNLDSLEEMKEDIVPSDYLMINRMIKNQEKNYFNCVLEKIGENHFLRKFE